MTLMTFLDSNHDIDEKKMRETESNTEHPFQNKTYESSKVG